VPELGYALSSEEHGPNQLAANAARAEDVGFEFALVSDHYHPWVEQQGEAPFVWTTLGGIARETDDLRVGTGVTCPTMRIHPAIIAQAAATTGAMFDGRFFLGVGTGERLNEHVLGDRWPPHHVRLEMLEEALAVMRELWTGEMHSHDGEHYTVENAQLFTLPEEPPDVAVAASGTEMASAAGRLGDALVSTAPSEDVVESFADADGADAPRYGQATVCWAETADEARETVREWWPNSALPGELGQELATPTHFEQATELVSEDDAVEHIPCGPDPDRHVEAIEQFADAGFDHVYLHQVGPDQEGFFRFYEEEVLPAFE
jgi:G6PDH family F420-dependent oxidoreductase